MKDNQIKRIEKENKKLREENKQLKEELVELKDKYTKLIGNLQESIGIKEDKKKRSKPLGAPIGHKGYARKIPERIDYVKALIPHKCPDCNTKLGETQEIRSRYVTDIKLISEAKTTRFDIHRKYCCGCKKLVEKEAPNVLPNARFGLNLMLLVMYLKLGLRLPGGKIIDYLRTMYNIEMSESEVVVMLRQLANAFGDHYSHLKKVVRKSRVKYSDTTSWRVNGRGYHVWVFITYGAILYKIHKRNNHKVGLNVLGTKQKGNILVVDRFSAFRTLAEKTGLSLQYCWSHILQDSKELARDFGNEGKYVHKKLKEIYELATNLDHKGIQGHIEWLQAKVYLLTLRHYKHSTVRRFINNLFYRDVEKLFRFVIDPDIDSTNNISERNLREPVIIRKISNGSRSVRGANVTATLLSVIQTLRSNQQNVLQGLQGILNTASGY